MLLLIIIVSLGEDKSKPDWKCLKEFLLREGPFKKEQLIRLIKEGIAVFCKYIALVIQVIRKRS